MIVASERLLQKLQPLVVHTLLEAGKIQPPVEFDQIRYPAAADQNLPVVRYCRQGMPGVERSWIEAGYNWIEVSAVRIVTELGTAVDILAVGTIAAAGKIEAG